jgi:predicted RND superfamily exporter protein
LGIAVYKPVFARVDAALEDLQVPGLRIEMTGDPIIWGRYLDRMVTDLLKSLALASAIILVVMGLVYRSVRIGLIAIVPNLFPLAATGAMLALFGIPLVIETVCAFTICLGIAVDDTIHFLSRYRVEVGRGRDAELAIRESFIKVGSPLVVTTVLMVTGFATVLWSELPGFRMFGAMACATLAAAFVADLLVLPALLKVFGRGLR